MDNCLVAWLFLVCRLEIENRRTSPRSAGGLRDHRRPLKDASERVEGGRELSLTRRAGNEEASLGALRQTEHVESAHERGLDGLDRVELVVRRRGGASKVVDF